MTGVDNLRQLDQRLRAGLSSVTWLRSRVRVLRPSALGDGLDHVLSYLEREVLPWAHAEEAVFYPEVARVLGVDLSDRMIAEHRDIDRLVAELRELRQRMATGDAVPDELYHGLTALIDLVSAHLRLESEALQGLVDSGLSDADAYELYERIEIAEFEEAAEHAAVAGTRSALSRQGAEPAAATDAS